jgi:hypothetical protein
VTAHTQPHYEPGTRVTGNYLGEADYTGVVIDTWPSDIDGHETGTMAVTVKLSETIRVLGCKRTVLLEFVAPDGSLVDGYSTLSVA